MSATSYPAEVSLSRASVASTLLQLLLRTSRWQLLDNQQQRARCSVIQHVCALEDAAVGVKVPERVQVRKHTGFCALSRLLHRLLWLVLWSTFRFACPRPAHLDAGSGCSTCLRTLRLLPRATFILRFCARFVFKSNLTLFKCRIVVGMPLLYVVCWKWCETNLVAQNSRWSDWSAK